MNQIKNLLILFNNWLDLKYQLHSNIRNPRPFKEAEIWWCAIGQNIGRELYGKSSYFSRPILIVKKFSRETFLGLPLTTQVKDGSWFCSITFQGKTQTIILNQVRIFDEKRLYRKIGELDDRDFEKVRKEFLDLLAF